MSAVAVFAGAAFDAALFEVAEFEVAAFGCAMINDGEPFPVAGAGCEFCATAIPAISSDKVITRTNLFFILLSDQNSLLIHWMQLLDRLNLRSVHIDGN